MFNRFQPLEVAMKRIGSYAIPKVHMVHHVDCLGCITIFVISIGERNNTYQETVIILYGP